MNEFHSLAAANPSRITPDGLLLPVSARTYTSPCMACPVEIVPVNSTYSCPSVMPLERGVLGSCWEESTRLTWTPSLVKA